MVFAYRAGCRVHCRPYRPGPRIGVLGKSGCRIDRQPVGRLGGIAVRLVPRGHDRHAVDLDTGCRDTAAHRIALYTTQKKTCNTLKNNYIYGKENDKTEWSIHLEDQQFAEERDVQDASRRRVTEGFVEGDIPQHDECEDVIVAEVEDVVIGNVIEAPQHDGHVALEEQGLLALRRFAWCGRRRTKRGYGISPLSSLFITAIS